MSASNGCIEDANMFTFHLTFTRNSYDTTQIAVEDEESPNLEFFVGIKIDEKKKETHIEGKKKNKKRYLPF